MNSNEKTIGEMFGLRDLWKAARPLLYKALGVSDEGPLMGVEIEAEFLGHVPDLQSLIMISLDNRFGKATAARAGDFIFTHAEASLVQGTELVLGPVSRECILEFIACIPKPSLKNLVNTGRGSTHVHMDVRDFTTERLWNLCALYRIVEPVLFKWVDPSRLSNPFCRPWFLDAFNSFTPRKYQALNLLPSGYTLDNADGDLRFHAIRTRVQGSIEYRHFPELLPDNIPLFRKWLITLSELHKASENLNVLELTVSATSLNNNSDNAVFLSKYFPKSIDWWLTDIGNDRLVETMSPVITQLKCNVCNNTVKESMKPDDTALGSFMKEVTKRKKTVARKKPDPEEIVNPIVRGHVEGEIVIGGVPGLHGEWPNLLVPHAEIRRMEAEARLNREEDILRRLHEVTDFEHTQGER